MAPKSAEPPGNRGTGDPGDTQPQNDVEYWYNEIPPRLFRNLHEVPDRYFPLLMDKWRTDIRCEDLDVAQRRILRDARVARVYYNPTAVPLSPSQPPEVGALLRKRKAYRICEEALMRQKSKHRLREVFYTYGVPYTRSTHVDNRRFCDKYASIPPYTGPHAICLYPWEVTGKSATKKTHYQVTKRNFAAHQMSPSVEKLVSRYKTTPLAVWKQHRFTSPQGCNFRELKEQMRAAKYKALLAALEQNSDSTHKIAVQSAHFTSNYHPRIRVEDGEEVDWKPDALDVGDTGRQGGKKRGPDFTVQEEYLEDLMDSTREIRKRLAPYLLPQPKGNFYQDPRKTSVYRTGCRPSQTPVPKPKTMYSDKLPLLNSSRIVKETPSRPNRWSTVSPLPKVNVPSKEVVTSGADKEAISIYPEDGKVAGMLPRPSDETTTDETGREPAKQLPGAGKENLQEPS